MDNVKEKRRYIRTELPIPAVIRIKENAGTEEMQAQCKNISATGIMLEIPKKVSPGVCAELSLMPKGASSPIHIKVTVIRSEKSKSSEAFNTGFEFNKVEEDNKNTFLKFLCDTIYKL
ncbi:MAG: PilZ domain-containing protein [Candidatus Omnitrophica bacterium]|nr:PilZ domain-containing protein [Candidatus Omnitrophota bacterium]